MIEITITSDERVGCQWLNGQLVVWMVTLSGEQVKLTLAVLSAFAILNQLQNLLANPQD